MCMFYTKLQFMWVQKLDEQSGRRLPAAHDWYERLNPNENVTARMNTIYIDECINYYRNVWFYTRRSQSREDVTEGAALGLTVQVILVLSFLKFSEIFVQIQVLLDRTTAFKDIAVSFLMHSRCSFANLTLIYSGKRKYFRKTGVFFYVNWQKDLSASVCSC